MLKKVKYFRKLMMVFFISSSAFALNNTSSTFYSPNNNISINIGINQEGKPWYKVNYKNEVVIDTSFLGFQFKNSSNFEENFIVKNIKTENISSQWEPVWGQYNSCQL